ncbi:ABC transporter ATP-binding protein [Desulfovibrio sp. OttesenSCG-928-G15]|nr:ABC transporter ATP-binding protein [Desulfovibrio sp. OttesenSCG-928-G15]
MIALHEVSKRYPSKRGWRTILDNITFAFEPGVNVGILGRNGAGKSTLLRLLGGRELPDTGYVERSSKISWPIGFSGGFNRKITGRQNLRFICRLYDESYQRVAKFVEDFAELGEYLDMPVHTYSSGMRAKLAFGISMAFDFDYYLIDEATAVGDAVFKKKSKSFFNAKRETTTLIVVSHSMGTVKSLCDKYVVLYKGKLMEFPTNEEAEEFYLHVCCGQGTK